MFFGVRNLRADLNLKKRDQQPSAEDVENSPLYVQHLLQFDSKTVVFSQHVIRSKEAISVCL